MKKRILIVIDNAECTCEALRDLADFLELAPGDVRGCEGDNYIADIVDEEDERETTMKCLKQYVYRFGKKANRIEIENGPSWTFFDSDNVGYTDTVTGLKVRENGKLLVEWTGERGRTEEEYDGCVDPDDEHAEEFNDELLAALIEEYGDI